MIRWMAAWCFMIAAAAASTAVGKPFVQTGHTSAVTSVAFSPDGRFVLSGSQDKTLKLWNLSNGREVNTFEGHGAWVDAVAFGPGGRTAVSAGYDGTLKLWDLAGGKLRRTFKGHTKPVWSAAFSPDGRYLLSGSADKTLRLWDVKSGNTLRTFNGHTDYVYAVAISPDGKFALSGSGDNTLRLWDVSSGKTLRVFRGHGGWVRAVAFSPDGKLALSGSYDHTLKLWDVHTAAVLKTLPGHTDAVTSVAFNPDGSQAVSGSFTAYKVWDLKSGRQIRNIEAKADASAPLLTKNSGYPTAVAFAPDGRSILAGAQMGTLEQIDLASGMPIKTLSGVKHTIASISVDDDYVVLGDWKKIAVWDMKRRRLVGTYAAGGDYVTATALSPEGKRILSGSKDNVVTLTEPSSGATKQLYRGSGWLPVTSIAFGEEGKKVYYAGQEKSVRFWEIAKGGKLSSLLAPKTPGFNVSAFSPDRRYALLAGGNLFDNTIKVWDVEKAKQTATLSGHTAGVKSLAFTPDGRRALSGGYDGTLRVWELRSGKNVRTITLKGTVTSVVPTADGRAVLSTDDEGMRLWDIDSGKILKHFEASEGANHAALTPDGRLALAVTGNRNVGFWELSGGKRLLSLIVFEDGEWVVMTPEGYFSASAKGTGHLNILLDPMTVTSLDAFYDLFYRPDLVTLKAEGKDITQLAKLDIKDVLRQTPPEAEITTVTPEGKTNRVKVCYKVESTGGGVGEVRLFHNGKLFYSDGEYKDSIELSGAMAKLDGITTRSLQEKTRALQKKKTKGDPTLSFIITKPKPETVTACSESFSVSGDNEYAVLAFNATNTVSSELRTKNYHSDLPQKDPKLYMVTIGVNQFEDPTANLSYAAKDSKDILDRFSKQAGTLFKPDNIRTINITDDEATKKHILKTIADLAATVEPQDYIVLFVASHGVVLDGQYYIVTHDYDGTLDPAKMVSSNEIIDLTKKLASLNQLLILDTCHAGGIDNIISGLYDSKVSVLAKKSGLHIYASANSKEEALDGYKGNGLFTYTILEGLDNNPAADRRKRGLVSIQDLGGFSKEETEKISKGLGHLQTPTIIHFGKDADIYKIQAR